MTSEHNPDTVHFVPLSSEPGPATPLSQDEAEALARAVVRRARVAAAGPLLPRWMMAAGVPLAWWGAGVAFAAVAAYAVIALPTAPAPSTSEPPKRSPAESAPSRAREPVRAAESPAAASTSATASDAEAHVAPSAETPTAPGIEAPAVVEPAPPAPAPSASALLDRANRLRAAGEYRRAEQLYSRAITAGASEADVLAAMVAAASLRLEHLHSPKSALGLYERVLRQQPEGPLAASARYGVAQSYRALGQPAHEIAALQRFLLHHPDNLLAKAVDDRLRTLKSAPSR